MMQFHSSLLLLIVSLRDNIRLRVQESNAVQVISPLLEHYSAVVSFTVR